MKEIKNIEQYNELGKRPSIVEFGTPDTCIPCKYTQTNLKKLEKDGVFDLDYYECSDVDIITALGFSGVPVVVLITPSVKVELSDSSIAMDEEELTAWIKETLENN